MATRFRSINATPPIGCYEYECGGVTVTSKSRFDIIRKVAALRVSQGLPVVGDPFVYVQDYMCPRMPNGFCTAPSTVKYIAAVDVKKATAELFTLPCVTSDTIESRLTTCLRCPKHVTRGFCMGCSGLIDWIYRGFGGRRSRMSPDMATGVCSESLELVAASASVDRELSTTPSFPAGCWRKAPEDQKNGK